MIIRFGAIDGSHNKTNLDEFKTTAQEKSSRFFFTILNFIIIIFIKSALNSYILKYFFVYVQHQAFCLINTLNDAAKIVILSETAKQTERKLMKFNRI